MNTADPRMRNLLTVTAVVEAGAGIMLLAIPSLATTLLLGSSLDSAAELTVARVAGVSLLALGVASSLARSDGKSDAAKGLVGAMVIYNAGVAAVLVYASLGLKLSAFGLWPAVLLHAVMTAWCVMCLLNRPAHM
jgi:hypothetical protein